MHHKPIGGDRDGAATTAELDIRYQAAVLGHLLLIYPETIRVIELIREMTGGVSDFTERDYLRRPIRDLMAGGLLFHVGGGVVQPTRAAILYHELEEA